MANPVMNYNQFMAAFKKAESGYRGKANVSANDKNGSMKINQGLIEGPVKGKGTPHIDKYTKQYMTTAKNKSIVGGGKRK
jgi:hypothetical protein